MTKQITGLALALSVMAGAAGAEGTLALYNWGDYINPEVLKAFTAETGIEVTLDTYSSNEEMLAKIQAGATGYDIVFPSVHMNDIMLKLGLLEKTDINAHPDFKNIDRPSCARRKTRPRNTACPMPGERSASSTTKPSPARSPAGPISSLSPKRPAPRSPFWTTCAKCWPSATS